MSRPALLNVCVTKWKIEHATRRKRHREIQDGLSVFVKVWTRVKEVAIQVYNDRTVLAWTGG